MWSYRKWKWRDAHLTLFFYCQMYNFTFSPHFNWNNNKYDNIYLFKYVRREIVFYTKYVENIQSERKMQVEARTEPATWLSAIELTRSRSHIVSFAQFTSHTAQEEKEHQTWKEGEKAMYT